MRKTTAPQMIKILPMISKEMKFESTGKSVSSWVQIQDLNKQNNVNRSFHWEVESPIYNCRVIWYRYFRVFFSSSELYQSYFVRRRRRSLSSLTLHIFAISYENTGPILTWKLVYAWSLGPGLPKFYQWNG